MAGQMLSEAGGWDAMSGQKVCAKPGLPQMPVRARCPLCIAAASPLLLLASVVSGAYARHAVAAVCHFCTRRGLICPGRALADCPAVGPSLQCWFE